MVKNEKNDVSNNLILIGIVALLVVSLLGTIVVLSALSDLGVSEADQGTAQASGEIQLTVVEPVEEQSALATGVVVLEVVEPK